MSDAPLLQILSYKCQGREIVLFSVKSTIGYLASTYKLQVQEWVEEGIGKMRGFNVRLPNGAVVNAYECASAMHVGVVFQADSPDVERLTVTGLIQACASAFSLAKQQFTWQQSHDDLSLGT